MRCVNGKGEIHSKAALITRPLLPQGEEEQEKMFSTSLSLWERD